MVALGAALVAETERDADTRRIRQLRDQILNGLTSQLPNVAMNGDAERRVVGNLNLRFDCVSAATLMTSLPGLALSSGSACSSGTPKPSHVLTALGLNREQALSSVRIGLGRFNTEAQATTLTAQVIKAVNDLRASSPLWALQSAGTELSWG